VEWKTGKEIEKKKRSRGVTRIKAMRSPGRKTRKWELWKKSEGRGKREESQSRGVGWCAH